MVSSVTSDLSVRGCGRVSKNNARVSKNNAGGQRPCALRNHALIVLLYVLSLVHYSSLFIES